MEAAKTEVHPERTVLFRQGEIPSGVSVVRYGSVKLSMFSSKGRAVILRVAQQDDMLGLTEFLSGEPSIATAETLEKTGLGFVERQSLREHLLNDPAMVFRLAGQASSSYQFACRQIALFRFSDSVPERVAQFLLDWLVSRPTRRDDTAELRLTHEEIAQIIGTSRETVTRTLVTFRKNGWARISNLNLVVENRDALEKLAAS